MNEETQKYIDEFEQYDLSMEYGCVNALQKTPWKINAYVLETLRAVWDSGEEWKGLPAKYDRALPVYPFGDTKIQDVEDKAAVKKFKRDRTKIHTMNNREMSKRIQVERTLQIAEEYAEREKMWYVWQCDFRGRKYPVESFLSPQNADYSKALLEFAESATIVTTEDAKWLAIHGANLFGVDKVSLEDREMWAYFNADKAIEVCSNPLESFWWQKADKPWQALAWCKEWAEYSIARANGETYETYLPCASDGTCNGLQHLSAMLRDAEGGRSVNLTPSPVPQDIYRDVAEKTTELLQIEADKGEILAQQLLTLGIDRKICKRPVMIVPYSGTLHACKSYIKEALEDKLEDMDYNPFGDDDLFRPSQYLARYVWQSISEVIVAAFEVMDYIKSIARLYAKAGKQFSWVTPTNLLVRQTYKEKKGRRVHTHISGSMVTVHVKDGIPDTINVRKAVSSSSPNFVHSLDASALTMTVHEAIKDGITDYAMVHDSFGTHSPNMPLFNLRIRESFAKLYTENDVLYNLYLRATEELPDADVPEPPAKGDLDINEVLVSPYFFS